MTDDTTQEGAGTLEDKKDLLPGEAGVYQFWKLEVDLAEKVESHWRKDSRKIKRIYRNSRNSQTHSSSDVDSDNSAGGNKFNILWSNTEILRPALFNSVPKPDVRRRFRDEDPVGAQIAEVAERSLEYTIDDDDLEATMDKVVLDHLLVGRGVLRVRYVPTFKKQREEIDVIQSPPIESTGPFTELVPSLLRSDNNEVIEDESNIKTDETGRRFIFGDEFDELVNEEVKVDLVRWDRFTHGPGSIWKDVTWLKYDHFLNKTQLIKAFGKKMADKIQLADNESRNLPSDENSGADQRDTETTQFKRAKIWEIWDKTKRQIIWIAPSLEEGPIKTEEDPLGLSQFFPSPEPLYSIDDTDTLVPIPEFTQYADQARELDKITARINKLISGLRARGVYDSTIKSIELLETAQDNQLVPVEEVSALIDKGGLRNAIWMYPIDVLVVVVQSLYIQRDQIRATIFEITGISDIQRGVTDPNETARAQSIKSRFGSQRLARRQRAVAKIVRDTIRLMAEIMMEKFNPETIQIMTGREISPEMLQVMQSDGARGFRIDIETDSTIANQQEVDEVNITKLLTAIAQYVAGIGPAVESGAIPKEAAIAILLGTIRKFKFGREVEDELVKAQDALNQQGQGQNQGQDQGPSEEQIKEQAEAQKVQGELKLQQEEAAAKLQLEQQKAQADNAIAQQKLEQDLQLAQQKLDNEKTIADDKAAAEIVLKREIALAELEIKREAMRQHAAMEAKKASNTGHETGHNTDHGKGA